LSSASSSAWQRGVLSSEKIAAQNLQAGNEAMVDRNHPRLGLGISLIAIWIRVAGLRLYIKKIES
jgi:hypothetical protein